MIFDPAELLVNLVTDYYHEHMKKYSFAQRLALLHELHFELANIGTIDDLCRTAIEIGRNATGIERLSIWFLDANDPGWFRGTFGIDERGTLRDERKSRVPINEEIYDKDFLERRIPFKLIVESNAYDDTGIVVGKADLVVAPIWDGVHSIGVLSADASGAPWPYVLSTWTGSKRLTIRWDTTRGTSSSPPWHP